MSTDKKDKQKVLDEVWTDERIRSFLDIVPPEGIDPDFHCLHTAYKSMRLDDFRTFTGYFHNARRNLKAKNPYGETVLDIISQHRKGSGYAEVLEEVIR